MSIENNPGDDDGLFIVGDLPCFIPEDKKASKSDAGCGSVPEVIGEIVGDAVGELVEEIVAEVVDEDPPPRRLCDGDFEIEDAVFRELPPLSEDCGDRVEIDRATYDSLMRVAERVNAGAVLVDPDDLRRVNDAVQQQGGVPGAGQTQGQTQGQQQVRTGAQALVEGGMSLIGGGATLVGAALKAGGQAVSAVAGVFGDGAPAGVSVLPRISEYRVDQAEKSANAYESALQKLWDSGKLPDVRKEIEARARLTGLSVEDVMEKMKPNGEMADLHKKFCAAVAESPDAQTQKRAMDKALEGWVRQYGRGKEELLNPETEGNPHTDALRDRLDGTCDKMKRNASTAPIFDGEDKSNSEKLREAIQRIMEKLKEIARDFVDMVRGKSGDCAPSP